MELEGDIGGFEVMLIAAIVIYVILALLTGPFWPLDYISGKAGCLGQIMGQRIFLVGKLSFKRIA